MSYLSRPSNGPATTLRTSTPGATCTTGASADDVARVKISTSTPRLAIQCRLQDVDVHPARITRAGLCQGRRVHRQHGYSPRSRKAGDIGPRSLKAGDIGPKSRKAGDIGPKSRKAGSAQIRDWAQTNRSTPWRDAVGVTHSPRAGGSAPASSPRS